MKNYNYLHVYVLLCLGLIVGIVAQNRISQVAKTKSSVDKDLTLTASEKIVLDQFKDLVNNSQLKDYMKKEIYLVHWLRAANFDLNRAERMIFTNLNWRKENRMDIILNEDWSAFRTEYEYDVTGVDKEGKPILYLPFGQWDVRKALVSGKRDRLVRYIYSLLESAAVAVRGKQENGETVTQSRFVINIDGFSLTQQGCLPCLIVYIEVVRTLNEYPGLFQILQVVNVPSAFQIVMNAVTPILPPGLLDVYGTNREEVKQALLKDINPDQLPVELGGDREIP